MPSRPLVTRGSEALPVRGIREASSSWPALRSAALGDSYGVMSFDVRGTDHAAGVRAAAAEFAAVVADAGLAPSTWVLIARLGSVDLSSGLVARRLQRSGAWWLPDAKEMGDLAGEKYWWHEEDGGALLGRTVSSTMLPPGSTSSRRRVCSTGASEQYANARSRTCEKAVSAPGSGSLNPRFGVRSGRSPEALAAAAGQVEARDEPSAEQ